MFASTGSRLGAHASAPRWPRIAVLGLGLLASCAPAAAPIPEPSEPRSTAPKGPPVQFAFETLDGQTLSTESLHGRISAIGFIATYDVASQAQARFLAAVARRHVPRINVALLVLESPDNLPLAQAFAEALPFKGPIAMADAATIAGKGPFAGLHHVPSVVILDRQGVEVWRAIGLMDEGAIDEALRRVEATE